MGLNKRPHHRNALRILKHNTRHSFGGEKVLSAFEILVLADDHSGDFVEQAGSRTHDAWTQSAHQHQGVPIPSAASIANANYFGVSGGIAGLDSQVVTTSDDFAAGIGENGSDGDAALGKTKFGFGNRLSEKLFFIHQSPQARAPALQNSV